ncbi:polysaccharide deacetylase family protein [bacterium]|nr:polysaccharide deacetylase family protein [bacterium]
MRCWIGRRRMLTLVLWLVPLALLLWLLTTVVIRPERWMHRTAEAALPAVLFRVDTDERAVALTIDDAPSPEVTPGLLEVLRRHDVRATFFVIGSHAEQHPELLEAIRRDGHEIANHLYRDRPSIRLSDAEFVEKLRRTEAIIQPTGPIKWCRPGSGWIDDRMVELLHENGYRACLSSVYPLDLAAPPTVTVWHTVNNARPGAILVLHDGGPARAQNVAILDELLDRLAEKGYAVLTVSELVAASR